MGIHQLTPTLRFGHASRIGWEKFVSVSPIGRKQVRIRGCRRARVPVSK